MRTKLFLPALLVAITSTTSINADDDTGFYAGLGLTRAAVTANDLDSSNTNGSIALGYMFNDRIGVDFSTYILGNSKDGNLTATTGTLALTGVYQMPVSERIDVFAKLGVARTELELKKGSTTLIDESTNDFIWGVGGKMDFGKHNILLEYNKLSPNDGGIDIINLGYRYEF
ncbi:MAG: porin family protein [Cocleimonas sp.]